MPTMEDINKVMGDAGIAKEIKKEATDDAERAYAEQIIREVFDDAMRLSEDIRKLPLDNTRALLEPHATALIDAIRRLKEGSAQGGDSFYFKEKKES